MPAAKKINQYYGTGRRKSSVARVFMRDGAGQVQVNKQPIDSYFDRQVMCNHALAPLQAAQMKNKFDFYITVKGGGKTGQAGAIRLGIARALVEYETKNELDPIELAAQFKPITAIDDQRDEPEEGEELFKPATVKALMRQGGYLTRDARRVLRKLIGLRKARKRPQYSKR